MTTNRIDDLFQQSKSATDFAVSYGVYLRELLSSLDYQPIGRFIEELESARQRGAHIFFIGNGGSAATASHFANDISVGTRTKTKHFKARSLTDNVAILTALANDEGYEQVFVRQLEGFASPGDLLVGISASGNSPNIIRAAEWAHARGIKIIGLTGFSGGRLRELSDISIHVKTLPGEYGPVEDLHMVVDHLVGAYLSRLAQE